MTQTQLYLELLWADSTSHIAGLPFTKETFFFPMEEQNCLVRKSWMSLSDNMLFLEHLRHENKIREIRIHWKQLISIKFHRISPVHLFSSLMRHSGALILVSTQNPFNKHRVQNLYHLHATGFHLFALTKVFQEDATAFRNVTSVHCSA